MLGIQLSSRGARGAVVSGRLNQVESVYLRRACEARREILQQLSLKSAPSFLMLACWLSPLATNPHQFSYFCHFF